MKEQIKPLITITALDGSMELLFEYECSFSHLRKKIRTRNSPIERDASLEREEERIIKGKAISDKSVLDEAIQLAKRHIIHNYLSLNDDRSINETDEVSVKVDSGRMNWRIRKYGFNRNTQIGDVVFEEWEMPFTEGDFTYLGKDKQYVVMGHTVHIERLNEYKHLRKVEVEWENYEAVGNVINRAREKYQSNR